MPPIKKRNRETTPVYGAVCTDSRGTRMYVSFSTDLQELIDRAEGGYHGIEEIEEAHANKPPVWKREDNE